MPQDESSRGPISQWIGIIVRVLLVPWITFITVFLCIKGYWWGLVFIPFIGLDLWLLRNLVLYSRTQSG